MSNHPAGAEGLGPEQKRRLLAELLRAEARRATEGPEPPPTGDPTVALLQQRQLFPALANKTYLNFGGQGPLPEPALEAICGAYREIQQRGPFSNAAIAWTRQQLDRLRTQVAGELGTRAEAIVLTENVSVGCNIVLWGLDWQPGDHLLLSDCEYPGVLAAVAELQRRFQIEVSTCPLSAALESGDPVAVLGEHLKPRTRLVVLSHILWNTGQVLPLQALAAACHAHSSDRPLRILVDAAQSVGVLPLALETLEADFYAFTSHKWLCGPEGVGGLYVRSEALPELHPTFISWRGLTPTWPMTGLLSDSRRYEVSTSAYPLQIGLATVLDLHNRWGSAEQRYRRIRDLAAYLWKCLGELQHTPLTRLQTCAPEAGIVTFTVGRSSARLVHFLEGQGILVRTIPQPECVRVCVHYLTLPAEIDRLCEAIQDFFSPGSEL